MLRFLDIPLERLDAASHIGSRAGLQEEEKGLN